MSLLLLFMSQHSLPAPTQAMLPYIFATAFPEKDNKLSPVVLWGVPIDPLNPVADTRISVVLVRFLRARRVDIPSVSTANGFLLDG